MRGDVDVVKTSRETCFRWSMTALTFSVCLLFAVASFAQLPTAKIVGTVKDSSAASVCGAMVRVTNLDTNITRTLTTGADGIYNALELPTGNYPVQVTATGFKTELRKGILLDVA